MKLLLIPLIAFSIFAGSFAVAETTQAAGATCTCWCGIEGRGAKDYGTTFPDATVCRTKCDAVKETFVSCSYPDDNNSPHTNLRCWDTKVCNQLGGDPSDKTPAECMPGFSHCFAVDEPVKLTVALGEFGFVQGIGGYINAFYRWILGAAALFAVIMIMVGAVQYMMSGGSSHGVGEARKRIFGALIGLVILLGAYLILNTVNPQLLTLKLPQIPKVRGIETPSAGNSCDSYADRGYTIKPQPAQGKCGVEGEIVRGPSGETLSGEAKCTYRTCTQPSGGVNTVEVQCQIDTEDQTKSACRPCESFTNDPNLQPNASGSLCNSFQYMLLGDGDQRQDCLYFPEKTTLTQEAVQAGTGGQNEYGFCGKVEFSCGDIDTCEKYGNIRVTTHSADLNFSGLTLYNVANSAPVLGEHLALWRILTDVVRLASRAALSNPGPFQQMCRQDPCELDCQFKDTGSNFLAWTDNRYQCESKSK